MRVRDLLPARALRQFIGLMLAAGSVFAAPPTWNAAQTHVLIASVVEWPATAGLAPFTAERRRDEDLAEQLRTCGVPPENIVFLKDSAATQPGIRGALADLAKRAGAGSTLLLYFQGHGSRKSFLGHDFDPARPAETSLHVDDILPPLQMGWQGERLLLIGDYCSSGALAAVVAQCERRLPLVRAACLASATASNKSTERWTFTAAFIDLLAGEPRADRDRDGAISFDEAGQLLLERMKYRENQLALAVRGTFEPDFVLRPALPAPPPPPRLAGPWQIGDVVEARDVQGKWYASEILAWDSDKDRYRIHFYGWDSKWDEWVEPARVRRLTKPKLTVGQQYEVQWQDRRWYLGTVVRSVDDWFYFVHYAGESGADDEWVTPERTRPLGPGAARQRMEFVAAGSPGEPKVGQLVAAQWHRQWWRARVMALEEGLYAVRYDDETDGRLSSDEIVPILAAGAKLEPGQRVLACWAGKPRMYPGKIVAVKQGQAIVRWEDGSAPTEVPLDSIAAIRP